MLTSAVPDFFGADRPLTEQARGYLSSQEFELARAEARVLSVEEAIE